MAISHLLVALSACATVLYAHDDSKQREPMITPAPIAVRQDDSTDTRLIGYYSESDDISWKTGRCITGMTWATSNSFGKCCSTARGCGRNDYATRCSGDYAIYPDGPYSCSNTCNTDYIYRSTDASGPSLWIGCNSIGPQTDFYRAFPDTITGAFTKRTTTTQDSTTSSASSFGAEKTSPTVTLISGGSTSSSSGISASTVKKSIAWIAGVVVGIVVFLVVCAIIIFCVISKKRKRSRALAAAGTGALPAQQQYMPPGQQQYMSPGQQQYMPPGQPGIGAMPPMQQQQYMPPPGQAYLNPASPDFKGDGSMPPQWTPAHTPPPLADPPAVGGISPVSPHASIVPGVAAHQVPGDSRSLAPTVNEIGTSNIDRRPVSEMTVPQSPPATHQPTVSELSSPNIHRPTPVSYQAGPIQQNYHPTVSEMG